MTKPLLPDAYFDIQDGQLGVTPGQLDGTHAKIGAASAGPINQVVVITNARQVLDTFVSGPLVESLLDTLNVGARVIYAMRSQASVGGVINAVVTAKTGTGVVTLDGNVQDALGIVISITRAGGLGVAAYTVSLDGGNTWSAERSVPAAGVVNLGYGVAATFAVPEGAGFVAGDRFSATATAPAMNTTDLVASLDALLAAPYEWEAVHVVGAASAAVAAVVATKLQGAEVNHRYVHAALDASQPQAGETVSAWKDRLLTEYAAFTSKRVNMIAAVGTRLSMRDGRQVFGSLASHVVGWYITSPVQQSAGNVVRGGIPGILSLWHDEFASPGLDAAGFTTLRHYVGLRGAYITNGRIRTEPGSDYTYLENRRVMDKACRLVRVAQLRWLHEDIRIDDAGLIDARDADAIGLYLRSPIDQMELEGEISSGYVTVNPEQNILSSSTLLTDLGIRPRGVIRWLKTTIGLINPKLAVNN